MMKKLIWLLVLLAVVSGTAAAEESRAWVCGGDADRVHLRIDPSAESASQGLYFTGTPVTKLLTIANGWTQVRIGAETGYIRSDLLSEFPSGQAAPVYETYGGAGGWVNLRSAPRSRAAVIGQIDNGTLVYVLGQTVEGWYYVQSGAQTGYVMKNFLRESDAAVIVPVSQVVGTAVNGDYIHACQADNGQTIYFTASSPTPAMEYADVNFDGQPDLVVTVAEGASNRFCEFFVRSGAEFVRVEHPGLADGLPNYQLYPAQGLVLVQASNGYAGALYGKYIFRWDGLELETVRRAESALLSVTEYGALVHTDTTYERILRVTVWDCTGTEPEGTVIFEQTADIAEYDAAAGDAALWRGL